MSPHTFHELGNVMTVGYWTLDRGCQVDFPGNRLIIFSGKQFLVMTVKWSAWDWSYREGPMVSTFVILSENLGLVPSTLIKVQNCP